MTSPGGSGQAPTVASPTYVEMTSNLCERVDACQGLVDTMLGNDGAPSAESPLRATLGGNIGETAESLSRLRDGLEELSRQIGRV